MPSTQVRAGIIQFSVGGTIQDAKGSFKYSFGAPTLKAYYGPTGEHQGFSSTPTTCFIEGVISDRGTLDVATLMFRGGLIGKDGLTITLSLENGKTFALYNAGWAGDGTVDPQESEIPVRWEGSYAEEIH